MLQVKIFTDILPKSISDDINKWLVENRLLIVKEIKWSVAYGDEDVSIYSCLIMYEVT